MANRPHSRKRGEATASGKVERRDEGLKSEHVGNSDRGNTQRPSSSSSSSNSSNNYSSRVDKDERPQRGFVSRPSYSSYSGGPTRQRGGFSLFRILLVVFLIMMLLNMLDCGGSSTSSTTPTPTPTPVPTQSTNNALQGYNPPTTTYTQVNSTEVNTASVDGVREKYTKIKGNGNDVVTVMVYMIGSDLETNYGMATSDLNEMLYAEYSDNVNVVVETGGSRRWKNSVMSNRTNQRWKMANGNLITLDNNVGSRNMADPNTLVDFINFSAKNFPADRYFLILWDHGGGSVNGYGHDEIFRGSPMSVATISQALKASGVKFDFVGFDACLMANAETAIAVEPYADYLLASEETEPGTGWYYTNWITALSRNTSMNTLDLSKQIIDDFIIQSARTSSRDKTSLSIVDLAEFDATVPTALRDFSVQLTNDIESDNYKPIAKARSVTKEFAQSTKIDQIDLVHFCQNINNAPSHTLADAVQSCVKYNRTNNMNNAYGLSIYFPYNSLRAVTNVVGLYENIGMEPAYSNAIKSFATLGASGQIVTGSSTYSLFDLLGGSSPYYGNSAGSSNSTISSEDILNLLLGQAVAPQQSSSYGYSLYDLLGGSAGAAQPSSLELFANMLSGYRSTFDTSELQLQEVDGHVVLALSDAQWDMITTIEQSVWVDDGTGYIDMGLDNVFEFDDHGNLLVEYDGNWMSLEGEPVAYYMIADEYVDENNYSTTGYVPCLINGEQKAHILIEFTPEYPDGHVYGVQNLYDEGVEARIYQLEEGNTIEFIADYYDYNKNFNDVYKISDPIPFDGELNVGVFNIAGQRTLYSYRLTDIFNTKLWTQFRSAE